MTADEHLGGGQPQLFAGLPHRRQRRNDASCYVDIVKADNRDIAGHRYTVPCQFGNEPECHLVGLAEHGTGPLVEFQPGPGRPRAGIKAEIARKDMVRCQGQAASLSSR
jgi:hypothetical protein